MTVSIHAPVRGRPAFSASSASTFSVSIHAPVRGRLEFIVERDTEANVSIHAPVRGRRPGTEDDLAYQSFRSTPL